MTHHHKPESGRSWRIWLLLAIGAGILLAVSWGNQSHSQAALAKYEDQLRRQSEKLTFAELGTSSQNWRAIHSLTSNSAWLDRLATEPKLVKWEAPTLGGESCPLQRGTAISWKELDQKLAAGESPLRGIINTLQNGPQPWVSRTNALAPPINFQVLITVGQWLAASAQSKARNGEREQALERLECLGHLANSNQEDATLVAAMIRVMLTRLATDAAWHMLREPGWSLAELERAAEVFTHLDPLAALEAGWLGERAGGYASWNTVMTVEGQKSLNPARNRGNWSARELTQLVILPTYRIAHANDDKLFYLQCIQETLDRTRQIRRREGAQLPLWRTHQRVLQISEMSWFKAWKHSVSAVIIPNGFKAMEIATHTEARRNLTLAAAAVKHWELTHQSPPEELDLACQAPGLDTYDP